MTNRNSIGAGTLEFLRTQIGRIEREVALYHDAETIKSGQKWRAYTEGTLNRAEVLLLKEGEQDPAEVEAINDSIRLIINSQWGIVEKPGVPW